MKKILIILAIIISVIVINKEQEEETVIIPHNAIRFRVIANSNTIEDQIIKNKISKNTEEYISSLVSEAKTASQTKEILIDNKENINNYVQNYMDINNIEETFKISIGSNYFPNKKYKGVEYKEGYYDSVVIELGESSGLNWWCVIYPPLCKIDNVEEAEYTTLVGEILSNFDM